MGEQREFTFKFNADMSALESAFSKLEASFSKTNKKISKELKAELTEALGTVYGQYGRDGKLPENVIGKMLGKDNMSTLSAFHKGDTNIIRDAGQLEVLLKKLNDVIAKGDTIAQYLPDKYRSMLGNLNGNQLTSVLKKVGSASSKLTHTDKQWQSEYKANEEDYWEKQEKKIKSYSNSIDFIGSIKKTKSATWYRKQADNMEDISKYGELFGLSKNVNGKYTKEQISELNDYTNAIRGIQEIQSKLDITTFKTTGKSKINLKNVEKNDLASVVTAFNQIQQLQNIVTNFENTYGKNVSTDNLFTKSSDFLQFDFDGKNFTDIVKNEFLTRLTNEHYANRRKEGMNELKHVIPKDIQNYYDTNMTRKASADANEKVNTARNNAKRSVDSVRANAEAEKQTAMNASSEELDRLNEEVAAKQAEVAALEQQIKDSQGQLSQQEYENNEAKIEEYRKQVEDLEKQLEQINNDYSTSQEENSDLKNQLSEAQKNKGTATDEAYLSAVDEAARLRSENEALSNENASLEKSLHNTFEELLESKAQNKALLDAQQAIGSGSSDGIGTETIAGQEAENLEAVRQKVSDIKKLVGEKTEEFKEEDAAVSSISENEATSLDKIRGKIEDDIIPAINKKTDAFIQEGDFVDFVVNQELAALALIEQKLDELKKKATIDITFNNNGNIPNLPNNPGGGSGGGKNKNITNTKNAYANYKYLLQQTLSNLGQNYTDLDYQRANNLIKNLRGFQGNSKFSSFVTPKEMSMVDTYESKLNDIFKSHQDSVKSSTYNATIDKYENAANEVAAKRNERLDYLDNNAPDQNSLALYKELVQLEQNRIVALQEIAKLKSQISNADDIDKKFIQDATDADNSYKQTVTDAANRVAKTKEINAFWDANGLIRNGVNQTYESTDAYLTGAIGSLSSMIKTASKTDDNGKSDYSYLKDELQKISGLIKAINQDTNLSGIVDEKTVANVERLEDGLSKIRAAVSKDEYSSLANIIDDYKKALKEGDNAKANSKLSELNSKRSAIDANFQDQSYSDEIDKQIADIQEQNRKEVETLQKNLSKRFGTLYNNQGNLLNLLFKDAQGKATSNQKGAIQKSSSNLFSLLNDLQNTRLGNDTGGVIDESGQLVDALSRFNDGLVQATSNLREVANANLNDVIDSFKSKYNVNEAGSNAIDSILNGQIQNGKRVGGFSNLQFVSPVYDKNGKITNLPAVYDSISQYRNLLEQANQLKNNKTLRYADTNKATNLVSNWSSWKQRNHASVLNNAEAQNIDSSISNISTMSEAQLDTLSSQIDKFEAKMNDINKVGKTFFDNIQDGIQNFWSQLLSAFSTQNLFNEIQKGIQYTTQYNSALIEMKKVSSDTDAAVNQFAKDAGSMANEIGSTSITIQNSAADWMRLGYSIKDATELAKNTSVLMNVSEFTSISDATESMVAMVQAFKDVNQDAGDLSMDIIDKLNNIGNNYSISTSELAESLQRSSGTLISAGNDIDKAVALTTAGNAQIQDPDSVGNALKVISMRLRGTSVSDIGGDDETTGMVTTASKLKDQIQGLTAINGKLGVSITDINGNYKDTYTILQEIADIWEDIGRQDALDGQNRQAALLEDLAGKNRASVLASILQNADMLRSVYEDVQTSEGSAMKENDTYMQSIVAHQEQLNNAYQELWNSDSYTATINAFLTLGTNILNVVKDVGLLKTALTGLAAIKGFKDSAQGVGIFKLNYDKDGNASLPSFNKDENWLASVMSYVKNGVGDKVKFENDTSKNRQYAEYFNNSSYSKDALKQYATGKNGTRESREAANFFSQFEVGERNADDLTAHFKTLNTNIGQFTVKTIAAKVATTALNVATSALATMLASLAIQFVVTQIDNMIHYEENLAESAEQAQQKISELNDTYKESADYVSENVSKYSELSKGVNDLGENVSLSTDDYNEFLEINNKLAELFPSLDRIYDSDGNAIVKLGDNAKSTSEMLNELLESKQRYYNQEILNQAPDILKNASHVIEKNSQKSSDYKESAEAARNLINELYSEEDPIGKLLNNGKLTKLTKQEAEEYARILKEQWGLRTDDIAIGSGYHELSVLFSGINKRQDAQNDYSKNKDYILESLSDKLNTNATGYSTDKEEIDSKMTEVNSQIRQIAESWLETNSVYSGFDDDIKKVAKTFFNNLDYTEYFKDGTLDGDSDIGAFLSNNFMFAFKDSSIQSDLKSLTEQSTGLSDGTTSVKKYANAYKDLIKKTEELVGVDSEVYKQFEKTYGSSAVSQLKNYNELVKTVGESNVDSLNDVDIALLSNTRNVASLYDRMKEGSELDAHSILKSMIKSLKNINISELIDTNLTDLVSNQTNLTSGTSSILNAFNSQNSTGFISNDTLKIVQAQVEKLGVSEKDLGEALIFTGNGMQLNTDKLNAMIKTKAYEQVGKLNDQYRQLDEVYARQLNDLDALKNSQNANTDATKAAIAAKQEEVNKTLEQMASLNKLKAEYQEYTDVYTKFQNALSTANQGARYDNMRSQKDTIDKLAKYGQFGVDEVEAYTEYYTNQDTTNMNFEQSAKWYKTAAANAKKYNTDSVAGIQALLKDIQGDGTAHTDENGNLVIDNIKEAAEKATVSVSFLTDAINKLKEYKIEVQYDQKQFDEATKEVLEQSKADVESEISDLETKLIMQRAQGASEDAIAQTQSLIDALKEELGDYDFQIKLSADDVEVWKQVSELENKIKEALQNGATGDEHYIQRWQQQITDLDLANPTLGIQAVVDSDLTAFQTQLDNANSTTSDTANLAKDIVDTLNAGAEFNISGNGVQSLATMKNGITALEEKTHYVDVEIRQRTVNADSSGNPLPTLSDGSSGSDEVTGGIALANGTMHTQKPGTTLVGEEGQELVVDRSTGKWRTVGDNGAEFTNIDKGDIVFNANQTKALLSSGHINGRGKALAGGQNNYDERVIQELLDEAHENKWPGTANLTREQLIAEIDKGLSGNLNTQTRQIFLPGDGSYQTFEGAWDTIGNKNIVYSPFLQNGKGVGVADKLDEETIFWYLDQIVGMSDGTTSDILRLDRIGIDDGDTHISRLISGVFDLNQDDLAEYTSEITHYVGQYFDRTGQNHYYNEWRQARANGQNNDLVGELGPEIRVHNGEWSLLGQNGAELTNISPSDMVIPADQTAKILSGKSYAEGKAYANTNYNPVNSVGVGMKTLEQVAAYQKKNDVYNDKATKDNTKATNKNTKATEDETKQTYNWIEVLANNIEHQREITSSTEAEPEWNSYSTRISGYRKMIEYDKQMFETYTTELYKYSAEIDEKYEGIRKAFGDDTATAEKYINLVKNGSLGDDWKTELIQEKAGDNATDEQKKAIEKAYTNQTKAISEAQEWISNLQTAETNQVKWLKQQHEDLKAIYDLQLEQNKALIDALDSQISEMETQIDMKGTVGDIVTTGDYEDLIAATDDKISRYYEQIDILQNELSELGDDMDSAEYQEIEASIADCNAQILECQKSQAEWNETIKQLPIDHIESYIENIKTAQSDLNDYIAELEAAGKKVTSDIIKQQMEVEQLLTKQYQNELTKVEKNLNTYTPGSDKWNSAFTSLQQIDDEISSIVQNMIGFNKQLLAMPVDTLSDVSDQLSSISEGLTAVQDDNLTVINAAIDTITRNAEELTKPLQKQLDLLQKTSEQRKRQLDIEQAAWDLEKAKQNKSVQVVKNGRIVYEADQDSVRQAQNSYDEAVDSKKQGELSDQIDKINDDADELKEKWEKIQTDSEYKVDIEAAAKLAGMSVEEFKQRVLTNNDDELYHATKNSYEDTAKQQAAVEEMSNTLSTIQTLIEEINTKYLAGQLTADQAKQMVQQLINAGKDGLNGQENLSNRLNIEQQESADSAVQDAKDSIAKTTEEYNKVVQQTVDNTAIIAEYQKKENELTEEIKKQLEKANEAYQNTLKAENTHGSYSSSSKSSGGGSSSSSSSSSNEKQNPYYIRNMTVNEYFAKVDSDSSSGGHSSSSNYTSSKSSSSSSSSSSGGPGVNLHYADGIENGAISLGANTASEKFRILQDFATNGFKASEVPIIADLGEAVLNPKQQSNVLNAINQSAASGVVAGAKMRSVSPVVNISLGDMTLPNVTNGSEFAQTLSQTIEPTMNQYFSKFFK